MDWIVKRRHNHWEFWRHLQSKMWSLRECHDIGRNCLHRVQRSESKIRERNWPGEMWWFRRKDLSNWWCSTGPWQGITSHLHATKLILKSNIVTKLFISFKLRKIEKLQEGLEQLKNRHYSLAEYLKQCNGLHEEDLTLQLKTRESPQALHVGMLHTTSSLVSTIRRLQSKCRTKDGMIVALADELKTVPGRRPDRILESLADPGACCRATDFDRCELWNYLKVGPTFTSQTTLSKSKKDLVLGQCVLVLVVVSQIYCYYANLSNSELWTELGVTMTRMIEQCQCRLNDFWQSEELQKVVKFVSKNMTSFGAVFGSMSFLRTFLRVCFNLLVKTQLHRRLQSCMNKLHTLKSTASSAVVSYTSGAVIFLVQPLVRLEFLLHVFFHFVLSLLSNFRFSRPVSGCFWLINCVVQFFRFSNLIYIVLGFLINKLWNNFIEISFPNFLSMFYKKTLGRYLLFRDDYESGYAFMVKCKRYLKEWLSCFCDFCNFCVISVENFFKQISESWCKCRFYQLIKISNLFVNFVMNVFIGCKKKVSWTGNEIRSWQLLWLSSFYYSTTANGLEGFEGDIWWLHTHRLATSGLRRIFWFWGDSHCLSDS